jgi:hypothetical protein
VCVVPPAPFDQVALVSLAAHESLPLPAVFFVLPFIPTLEVKPVSKARRINVNVVVFQERAMGSG